MPAAAHDAPRPGALSTTVTPRPAWAARQAMPRPITPPPTTTTSLVPASAALVLIRATLPSPALPGAGSDGRRRTAALSARWHPGSRVAPAYASRWPRGHGSAPGHGRRGPIGCSSGQPLRTPVTCAASRDPRCAPCGAPPPQVIPGAAPVHDRRSLVHVAVAGAGPRVLLLLRLVHDQGLGREQQRGDGGGVLHRGARDLGGVDDPRLYQVDVLAGGRIEAVVLGDLADLVDRDGPLEPGVGGDPVGRQLERLADDLGAGRLVAAEVELADGLLRAQQRDLGGRADADDRDAAGQLGQALLELLAVPIGVGPLDLLLDLVDLALDVLFAAGALDDGGLVLGHRDAPRATQQVERDVLQLEADLLGDDLAARQDRHVIEHRLAAVAEPGGLDRDRLEGAADLVDHQGRQGLALDVLGDDHQRLARLDDLLEHREQVLGRGDLLVDDQDVGVVEDRLHPLLVGGEVGRDVALVELHALGELQLHPEGLRLVDGDDPVLADLVHRLGDGAADLGVLRGDGGDGGDLLLGLEVTGVVADVLGDRLDGPLDAALEPQRVGAGGHVAEPLVHQRLRQHGGGGGAVTGDVVGLGRDFLGELGPEVLVVVLELDLLGDRHTIVGDGGRAPLLVEHDVATLGAECHPHHIGELVDTRLQRAPRLGVEQQLLWHWVSPDLLVDDGEHVAGGEDQVVLAAVLDLGAAVLGVDDGVADLDVERHPGAVLEPARAHRDDLALLGLLLGGVGDDDARSGRLLALAGLDDDAVLERLKVDAHSVPPVPGLTRPASGHERVALDDSSLREGVGLPAAPDVSTRRRRVLGGLPPSCCAWCGSSRALA